MAKAAAYTVLVDDLEVAVGDGPVVKFAKGQHSPKNEYEELCLQVNVEHGYVKAPAGVEAVSATAHPAEEA